MSLPYWYSQNVSQTQICLDCIEQFEQVQNTKFAAACWSEADSQLIRGIRWGVSYPPSFSAKELYWSVKKETRKSLLVFPPFQAGQGEKQYFKSLHCKRKCRNNSFLSPTFPSFSLGEEKENQLDFWSPPPLNLLHLNKPGELQSFLDGGSDKTQQGFSLPR